MAPCVTRLALVINFHKGGIIGTAKNFLNHLQGSLDDIRIYKRDLTHDEKQYLYNIKP